MAIEKLCLTSSSAWGGSFTYAETFVGQVPLVDPASEQTPGESPDGTPDVPPPDPLDVPAADDDTLTTISYSQQWTGSQSQNDYDSFGDVITFGPSGVTTTARLGFGGGGYAVDLVSSSTLSWTQTTGDAESSNWSIAAYGEGSQFDLSSSGGYLSMTNLTIVDGGSDLLVEGLTGTFSEDGSDHTNILITTQGATTYNEASVVTHDGPTVEPTVTSSVTSVDNFDDTIHIVSGDTYNDIVTFSGSDSLAVEHSQTDTYSFSLTSLGGGMLSVQTEMDYPQSGNSLATFDESYTQTLSLDSGSTTNSSFAVQTVGEVTTVSVGPITETGTDASSLAYESTGTSTFHSSETGIYIAPAPSADPTSGEPIDPNEQVASPFEGLPTLTIIESSATWTDALSINNQSAYEQTITFNPDDSVSLDRTETGSGTSSFDQTLISTLEINDETGSIDDGLGTVFTFNETSNFHSWEDGESSSIQSISLISTANSCELANETSSLEAESASTQSADHTIVMEVRVILTDHNSGGASLVTSGSQSSQAMRLDDSLGLQTSNDAWDDIREFSHEYWITRTSSLNLDGTILIESEDTGSGNSTFEHTGSGSSNDVGDPAAEEPYVHHVWENSDYSYITLARFTAVPVDPEHTDAQENAANPADPVDNNAIDSLQTEITDFSHVMTVDASGGAELNGTTASANSVLGSLPIHGAEILANASATQNVTWDTTTSVQQGMEKLDDIATEADQGEIPIQFVAFQQTQGKQDNRSKINRIMTAFDDPKRAIYNESATKLKELLGKYGYVFEAAELSAKIGSSMAEEMKTLVSSVSLEEYGLTVEEIEKIVKFIKDQHGIEDIKDARPRHFDEAINVLISGQRGREVEQQFSDAGHRIKWKEFTKSDEALIRGIKTAIAKYITGKLISKLKSTLGVKMTDALEKELTNFFLEMLQQCCARLKTDHFRGHCRPRRLVVSTCSSSLLRFGGPPIMVDQFHRESGPF